METLSAAERAWIWLARLLGGSMFVYSMVALGGDVPTPAYAVIGGLLGGGFVYKAQKKARAEEAAS